MIDHSPTGGGWVMNHRRRTMGSSPDCISGLTPHLSELIRAGMSASGIAAEAEPAPGDGDQWRSLAGGFRHLRHEPHETFRSELAELPAVETRIGGPPLIAINCKTGGHFRRGLCLS